MYENYAELGLNGDVSSKEIFSAITPRLELRKFEFVEPSLNSIFLNVVGATVEQIEGEKSAEHSASMEGKPSQVVPSIKNREVKKRQVLFILAVAVIFVSVILSLKGADMWPLAGAGVLAAVTSFLRLKKAKNSLTRGETNE